MRNALGIIYRETKKVFGRLLMVFHNEIFYGYLVGVVVCMAVMAVNGDGDVSLYWALVYSLMCALISVFVVLWAFSLPAVVYRVLSPLASEDPEEEE